jgi:drug/metabolite transporter (DMT)-like permease
MSTPTNYSRGVLLCLIATVSWGGMFPVMTSALRHIDPFTFTCLRYGIAGLVFLAVLLVKEGRGALNIRGQRPGLAWLFGTAGFAGFQFLVFLGQKWAGPEGALVASIMMATMPMLGFLVNWVVRKAVPPRAALAFILMSFAGVVLVVTKGNIVGLFAEPGAFKADLLIILGALCWVIYTVGATFFPKWSPVKYTTVTTGLGMTSAVAITAILLATGLVDVPSGGQIGSVLPELAYMSLVAGFVGVLAWNVGNKILTPLNGVLFMDVVPITAFIVSALTGTIPVAMQIVGALVTASALVCNNLVMRHRMAAASAPAPAAPVVEPVVEPAVEPVKA